MTTQNANADFDSQQATDCCPDNVLLGYALRRLDMSRDQLEKYCLDDYPDRSDWNMLLKAVADESRITISIRVLDITAEKVLSAVSLLVENSLRLSGKFSFAYRERILLSDLHWYLKKQKEKLKKLQLEEEKLNPTNK